MPSTEEEILQSSGRAQSRKTAGYAQTYPMGTIATIDSSWDLLNSVPGSEG